MLDLEFIEVVLHRGRDRDPIPATFLAYVLAQQLPAFGIEETNPTLLPLPIEPFRYYQYGDRTVHLDGCVEVEAAYYSVPPGWIGRWIKVQWDPLHVRI